MAPVVHPGRLLKREMAARKLSANRLSLDIGVPSGRVTDILNGRRAITADTAVGGGARQAGGCGVMQLIVPSIVTSPPYRRFRT